MGFFGESRKEREAREERALNALLNAFEKNIQVEKSAEKSIPTAIQKNPPPSETISRQATLEDLILFLDKKGMLPLSEWEKYKTEHRLSP
jgi:hypothetical protein